MSINNAAGSRTSPSSLPQPPRGYAPGQDDAGRPPCARCMREGGIVLFGTRRAPNRSDLHPNHTHPIRGKGGRVEGMVHQGPREPLCAHHVELVAWEVSGESLGYAKPAWARV